MMAARHAVRALTYRVSSPALVWLTQTRTRSRTRSSPFCLCLCLSFSLVLLPSYLLSPLYSFSLFSSYFPLPPLLVSRFSFLLSTFSLFPLPYPSPLSPYSSNLMPLSFLPPSPSFPSLSSYVYAYASANSRFSLYIYASMHACIPHPPPPPLPFPSRGIKYSSCFITPGSSNGRCFVSGKIRASQVIRAVYRLGFHCGFCSRRREETGGIGKGEGGGVVAGGAEGGGRRERGGECVGVSQDGVPFFFWGGGRGGE